MPNALELGALGAFDLLYLNGSDLRPAALIDRKRALRELPATPLFLSFCCSQPGS